MNHRICRLHSICDLTSFFQSFFIELNKVHKYNARLAMKRSYYLSKVVPNTKSQGLIIRNVIDKPFFNFIVQRQKEAKFASHYLTTFSAVVD